MPIAVPTKTARKRASLDQRASSARARAHSAAVRISSCSSRTRSRSAWAYPAASAPWIWATRCGGAPVNCSASTAMVRSSVSGCVKCAATRVPPTSYASDGSNLSAVSTRISRDASEVRKSWTSRPPMET